MSSSDPSVIAILIKLVCVAASIVIGAIMVTESQCNGVARRDLLLTAAREGLPKAFLKHTIALSLNLIFLWLLQFAVFTLVLMLVGLDLEKLLHTPFYILAVSAISLPLVGFVIAGKRISIRRPTGHP